ncbi:MtrAB system accessory lipoprotein LpqB [Corynebacterium halotolerans]|uniref:Lipoprotein LpqB n=1 Tax=Corynebacterium halotolerans YIM 70093 = DSM 44683 TaxID=1121362 RepID=M1NQG7_9CORY|nr:MtrAB system accessory lipoprotein LpqB [Corynebacterium halotolerans]AGF71757.1 lipoprotein LpqB [Corynebacterium halotolerans YIM 70093 = DSM 44683]
MIRIRRSWRTGVAVFSASVLLAGCTALPSDTEPQALRPFEPAGEEQTDLGPQPGREPDLLLRDFYTASADPAQDYQAARSYLTPEAAEEWNPSETTLVVDRVDLATQPGSTNERRSFNVRGAVIGRLGTGGAYEPENGVYEATIELEQQDGEWRIASLPDGVVFERTELRNRFQPQNVYFFDSAGQVLVGDRRWVYSGQRSLDTALITLMMEGPSRVMAPAVEQSLPPEAAFAGVTDGAYQFTGFSGMSREDRLRFTAQLVWTLAMANTPGPYSVMADGAPVIDGQEELTTDDFADFNPRIGSSMVAPLFALTDEGVYRVASNTANPVSGPLGSMENLESVDITAERTSAAVRRDGDESVLLLGGLSGEVTESLRSRTITRPTFEYDSNALWVTLADNTVVRTVKSSATGEFASSEVNTTALEDIGGDISVLRLSHSGARVAMIIEGRVYTGVVEREGPGERSIVNVQEFAPQLGGTALSLDWQPDGSILVGTSSPETPIWRVESDGSAVSSLPSGNVTAPVVTVAASSSTIYLTDALSALQMPVNGADTSFWREVPGLQGVRAAPIVAN